MCMALEGLRMNMICIRHTLFNIMKHKTNFHNRSTCLCAQLCIITNYKGQSSYPPQRAKSFESATTTRFAQFHLLQSTCKNHGRINLLEFTNSNKKCGNQAKTCQNHEE